MDTDSTRSRRWLDLALLTLLLGIAWSRFLFHDAILYSGDTFYYFYPLRFTLFTALQHGYFPDWESAALSGNPFCANPQANCYYPLSLWYLLPDFFRAYQWSIFSHLVIGAAGCWIWLCGRGHSRRAAILAAAVFAMSGPTISMVNRLDKLESLCWWPWAMAGLEATLRRRPGGLPLLAASISLQLLAGGLEVSAMTFGALLLWGGLVPPHRTPDGEAGHRPAHRAPDGAAGHPPPERAPDGDARPMSALFALLAAFLLCALLTAPQWVTLRELIDHSSRSAGMSFDKAVAMSMRASDLWSTLFPHVFYDPSTEGFHPTPGSPAEPHYFLSLYLGWLPLLAVAAALPLAVRRHSDGAAVRCASIAIALALFFAAGGHNPLYHALFDALPSLRAVRYPEKFLTVAAFFVLPLLAVGVDRWHARGRGYRLALGFGLAVTVLLLVVPGPLLRVMALVLSGTTDGAPEAWAARLAASRPQLWLQALVLTAVGLTGTLEARGLLRPAIAHPLVAALVALDLWSGTWQLNPPMDGAVLRTPPAFASALRGSPTPSRVHVLSLYSTDPFSPPTAGSAVESYDWLWQLLYPNSGLLSGLAYADGARALRLDLPTRFFAALRGMPADRQLELAALAGIDTVVSSSSDVGAQLDRLPGLTPIATIPEKGLALWRLKTAVPRAYLVSQAFYTATSKEGLRALLDGRYSPRDSVGLVATGRNTSSLNTPTGPPEKAGSTAEAGSIPLRFMQSRGGAQRTFEDIGTELDGWLVLTEAWYPGWMARVDGHPAEVLPANGYQQAIRLPPGRHRVDLEFVPRDRNVALVVAAIGVGLLGVIYGLERRLASRPRRPPL